MHFITRSKLLSLQSHELKRTENPLVPFSSSTTSIGNSAIATSKLSRIAPGIIATILPDYVLLIKDGNISNEEAQIPIPLAHDIVLSPSGLFLAVYKKPDNNATKQDFNVSIWNTKTLKMTSSFSHKTHNTWIPQWTSDEKILVRQSPSSQSIIFYKEGDQEFHKILLSNISSFSLSPSPANTFTIDKIAIFVKESNNMPASVKVYLISDLDNIYRQKSFFKADKCTMKWSHSGSNLLIESQTEVDSTGHSYYGETSLYFLGIDDNDTDLRVPLDKEGPIHDFEWSPKEDSFIVCYGYMPSKAMQFNSKCLPLYEYPLTSKNHIRFNPQGSLVSFGAFGNLPGHVEVWTSPPMAMKILPRRIGHFQSQGSSVLEWSPCGRYMLTGILTPRLRVDNGWKLWAWNGSLLMMESYDELYQLIWDPRIDVHIPIDTLNEEIKGSGPRSIIAGSPDISTTNSSSSPITRAVYRPPGLRKLDPTKVEPLKQEQKSSSVAIAMPASTLTNEEKKIKKLTEKYESILNLQKRHNCGEELELNQLEKISRISQVREELLKAQKEFKKN